MMSQLSQRLPTDVVTDAVSEEQLSLDDISSGHSSHSYVSQSNLPAQELFSQAGSLFSQQNAAAQRGQTGAQWNQPEDQWNQTGAHEGQTVAHAKAPGQTGTPRGQKLEKKKNKFRNILPWKAIAKATHRSELPSVSANTGIPDAAAAASSSPEYPRRQADSSGAASGSMTGLKQLPSGLMANGNVMKPESLKLNHVDRHVTDQVELPRNNSNRAYSGRVTQSSNYELQEYPGLNAAANSASSCDSLDSLPSKSSYSDAQPYAEFIGIEGRKYRVNYSEIEVDEDEIPVYLKEQYDIALMYADDDREEAMAFKCFLERYCFSNEGEPPKVCTIDYNADMVEGSKIKHLEVAMRVSTYVFLYITKTFCSDNWATLSKDEVLMHALNNPEKRWCIVPVLTQSKNQRDITKAYKVPFGLTSLKPVDICHITKGESLQNLMRDDPEDGFGEIMTETMILKRDRFFLPFFRNMMSKKQPVRQQREKQVEEERARFVANLRQQRATLKAEQMAKDDANRVALEKKKKEKEEELTQRFYSGELADLPEPKPDQYGNYGYKDPRHQVKSVEGGTTYIYNFHGDINGTSIPTMPSGTHNEITVEHAGIMQVGDYNTATTLTQDEEQDLHIPNRDVPQRRYMNQDSSGDEESPRDSSPLDHTNMDEVKSLPRPQNLHLGQNDSINMQLFSHQNISHAKQAPFNEAPEIQLQFELEEQLSYQSSGDKQRHTSYVISHRLSEARDEQDQSEASSLSNSDSLTDLYSAAGPTESEAEPVIRSRHFSAARGSPTENESSEDLQSLSVCEDRSGASSAGAENEFMGTSDQDLVSKSRLLNRVNSSISVASDVPSISERQVEGCENESPAVQVTMVSTQPSMATTASTQPSMATTASTQPSMATTASTQPSLPSIDLPDPVELEKKEAQSEFAKAYFEDLCKTRTQNSETSVVKTNYVAGTTVAKEHVTGATKTEATVAESAVAKGHVAEATVAESAVAKGHVAEVSVAESAVAKGHVAEVSVAKAVSARATTVAPSLAMPLMSSTSSFDCSRLWDPATPTFAHVPGQLDSRDVLPCDETSSLDLGDVQRFLDNQRQDMETPRGPLSQEYLRKAAPPQQEENSLDPEALMDYVRQQREDMERPRAIETFQITPETLDSNVNIDGDELRRRYQAWLLLQAAFPHHVNPQWVMGRPLNHSIPSLPSQEAEDDDEDAVD